MSDETEKQILEEMRRQTELGQKLNQRTLRANLILVLALLIAVAVLVTVRFREKPKPVSPVVDSWREASSLANKGDFQKAIEMTQRLIQQHPKYYYGYSVLGAFYLETENLKKAEENYAKAYELLPTEENEKMLAAIRKVLAKENSDSAQPNK